MQIYNYYLIQPILNSNRPTNQPTKQKQQKTIIQAKLHLNIQTPRQDEENPQTPPKPPSTNPRQPRLSLGVRAPNYKLYPILEWKKCQQYLNFKLYQTIQLLPNKQNRNSHKILIFAFYLSQKCGPELSSYQMKQYATDHDQNTPQTFIKNRFHNPKYNAQCICPWNHEMQFDTSTNKILSRENILTFLFQIHRQTSEPNIFHLTPSIEQILLTHSKPQQSYTAILFK
eukprot:TRINITY_DN2403_c0_g1_i2.p1 TRINITY_DN2403_c0_g1~~TRINITY_DN2403_c0_g1_i2.p1  ORF type:complete len:228 (-),score=-4.76 TRINITY_DN2403_c0_g1_i2:472-1155(-)